jgi:hypothetical protein
MDEQEEPFVANSMLCHVADGEEEAKDELNPPPDACSAM